MKAGLHYDRAQHVSGLHSIHVLGELEEIISVLKKDYKCGDVVRDELIRTFKSEQLFGVAQREDGLSRIKKLEKVRHSSRRVLKGAERERLLRKRYRRDDDSDFDLA